MEKRNSVLIICSSPIALYIEDKLSKYGYEKTKIVDDLETGYEVLSKEEPKIIFIESYLVSYDDYSPLKEFRKRFANSYLIVFNVDRYSPWDLNHLVQAGADDYMPRPFDVRQLKGVVDDAKSQNKEEANEATALEKKILAMKEQFKKSRI
jgi:DNA-binding response OmpR family regulator